MADNDARAGTIRSPLWRKGGVTFAAKPRDYTQKVNRKMYRAAISSIFSSLNNSERLFIVDNMNFSSVKTRDFVNYINNLSLGKDILFILNSVDEEIYLASRNIASVNVIDIDMIDPILLLQHKIVVIEKDAILSKEFIYLSCSVKFGSFIKAIRYISHSSHIHYHIITYCLPYQSHGN